MNINVWILVLSRLSRLFEILHLSWLQKHQYASSEKILKLGG